MQVLAKYHGALAPLIRTYEGTPCRGVCLQTLKIQVLERNWKIGVEQLLAWWRSSRMRFRS